MSEQIIAILGIDLGKNSISLAGLDAAGAVILRRSADAARVGDLLRAVFHPS